MEQNAQTGTQEIDIELLEKSLKPFAYKWTKGENDGEVCELDNVFRDATNGIIWINFKGGSRINYELLHEYMMELDPGATQQNTGAQSTDLNSKNVRLSTSNSAVVQENPIVALLKKQSENWVDVQINLRLNLPTGDLYKILTTSFDDAEKEIIEFVVSDLDLEIIKTSLRDNIKEIYKAYGTTGKSGSQIRTQDKEQGDN